MENETFRTRVANLVARSRKALRLYSNAERSIPGRVVIPGGASSHHVTGSSFSEVQAGQWKEITADLLNDLTEAVQKNQSVKNLSAAVFTTRDKFNSLWRSVETEIHIKHKEVQSSLETRDYVKVAVNSAALVGLKAKYQAAQAAHHELEELIKTSHYNAEPIKLTEPMKIDEIDSEIAQKSVANLNRSTLSLGLKPAKVIPIRKVL